MKGYSHSKSQILAILNDRSLSLTPPSCPNNMQRSTSVAIYRARCPGHSEPTCVVLAPLCEELFPFQVSDRSNATHRSLALPPPPHSNHTAAFHPCCQLYSLMRSST